MRKLVSAPTIVFKGSGWAKKDRQATSSPAPSRASSNGTGKSGETAAAPTAESTPAPAQSEQPAPATPAPTGGSSGD
jgi:hypothetical protein